MHNKRDTATGDRTRPRTSGFVSIDDVALLSEGAIPNDTAVLRVRDLRLSNAWKRAVGRRLSLVSDVLKYRGGRLTVSVRGISWKRALDELKPAIMTRLEQVAPTDRIDHLSFTLEKAGDRTSLRQGGEPAPVDRGVDPKGNSSNRATSPSGDLRQRLEQVAARYLSRSAGSKGRNSRTS